MGRAQLNVLSRDEVDRIHGASLELLEQVGVLVREPRAMRHLLDAGATKVGRTDRVLVPGELIQEAIAKTPKAWTWLARERARDVRVGDGGRTRLGPGSACSHVVDFETGAARAPTVEDADRLVRLMDALEHVDINYSPVTLPDDGTSIAYREAARLVRDLQNTSKVSVGPSYDGTVARAGLEIAAVLAGGQEELRKRPTVAGYCDPVGPLVHDRAMTETLIEYAALGQPVFIVSADLAGASAPATLAGTLVQQGAELLSGLLIAHLVNPRAPVILGSVSGAMDMRSAAAAFGGPELGLLSAATVQLCHRYGLPCSTGGQSDAKVHDAQASLEKASTLFASMLAGADFVDLYFGSFEGFNATSPEQVVIDEDIAALVLRYARGIEVSEETLAMDVIREVGAGGSYLTGRRTLGHARNAWKSEMFLPSVIDRRARHAWALDGGRTLLESAHLRVERILRDHRPTPIEPEVLRELGSTLGRIRRETGGQTAA